MLKVLQHWNGISLPTIVILICCKPMFHKILFSQFGLANECPTKVYVYSLLFDKKGKLMTDGGLKWSDFASTMDQLHGVKNTTPVHKGEPVNSCLFGRGRGGRPCVRTPAGSQMCAICVHRGGGGQKRPKNCVYTFIMPPWEYSSA